LHPSTLTELTIDGPVGTIDIAVNDPGPTRCGIALIAHPHPLQGGTRDNKVVTSLARALFGLGYCAVRPNFRGVGASEGVYDQGIGETDDLLAVAGHFRNRLGALPVLLAGFSFGAFVQTRVAHQLDAERLALIAPAVNRFDAQAVAPDTLVVHGDQDDVVSLADVLAWAGRQNLAVVVTPGGGHFFHGRLGQLQSIVKHWCLGHRNAPR
jgi:alpha/beta superfamily hydrolase